MGIYKDLLLKNDKAIASWGAGYIGYSTMAHFADQGVRCVGLDTDSTRVEKINNGDPGIPGLLEWMDLDIHSLTQTGKIRAALDLHEIGAENILVHFVCIPTERDGKPWLKPLAEVVNKLRAIGETSISPPPVIIIESTLTPGTTEQLVIPSLEQSGLTLGKDILLGVAPRRDWFVDATKSLRELDRVYGATDIYTSEIVGDILSIVCDHLHKASSHRTSEMVKSVENAYRHVEITLANQLSLAYPHEDIREVLRLVGTKWNIGTFYPGFGTGGYCIPLSSQYVLDGAESPHELTILTDTVQTDSAINLRIARSLAERGLKRVGILGLAYKANLPVHILSPTLPFINELKRLGIDVKLHDPHYSNVDIDQIAGVSTFQFPDELTGFDAVVAVVDHAGYRICQNQLLPFLSDCKLVIDNMGVWQDIDFNWGDSGIEYHIAGDADWLGN